MDCALDLMRRLPPQQIEKNLSDLIDLVPSLCEDLLTSVDQPLKIAKDKESGKDYLLCDYNRDGDSYRYNHLFKVKLTNSLKNVNSGIFQAFRIFKILSICPFDIHNLGETL